MPHLNHILANTPAWVFAVLGYLVWQGIESLRPRTMPLWRALIVPALFIVSGVSRIVMNPGGGLAALMPWFIALIVFLPLSLATGPRLLAVDHRKNTITRTGSPVPLVRNVVVFSLQYVAAVLAVLPSPDHAAVTIASHAISGATAGYFIGWAGALLIHFKRSETTARR